MWRFAQKVVTSGQRLFLLYPAHFWPMQVGFSPDASGRCKKVRQ